MLPINSTLSLYPNHEVCVQTVSFLKLGPYFREEIPELIPRKSVIIPLSLLIAVRFSTRRAALGRTSIAGILVGILIIGAAAYYVFSSSPPSTSSTSSSSSSTSATTSRGSTQTSSGKLVYERASGPTSMDPAY